MNIIARLIDKISNLIIKMMPNDLSLKIITKFRYKLLRHIYTNKYISTEKIIISLTSYPPRFKILEHTLMCLLSQTIQPKVVLWIYEEDARTLPPRIQNLLGQKLEIRTTKDDYRSYKKIYPAIKEFPGTHIITADDDIFYNASWAELLLQELKPNDNRILGHRAHRMTFDENGNLKPYNQWNWQIGGNQVRSGFNIFLTGGAGALYPAGSLKAEDLNPTQFMDRCETADDVWLYFATTKNRYLPTKIPSDQLEYTWRNSQSFALKSENIDEAMNDKYLVELTEIFGKPWQRTVIKETKCTQPN